MTKLLRQAARLGFAGAFCLAAACTKSKVVVQLKVDVKTNQGDPVAGALVKVDNVQVGETNAQGQLQLPLSLSPKSRQRVEITKQSDTYYFAPDFQSFAVNESEKQDVALNATLYFVPKPTPDGVTPPEQPTSAGTAALTPAAEATPVAAEIAQEKPADSPPPAVVQAPLKTEEQTHEEESGVLPTKPVLSGVVEKEEPPLTGAYPKASRPSQGETVFTVHVFSGETPVQGANVFMGTQERADLRLACKANSRGRCVIRLPAIPAGPVNFVAKRRGYRTKSVSAEVSDGGKLRINLEPGATLDIFAITQSYNYVRGLDAVAVTVKGKSIGATDVYGRLSHVYGGKPSDLLSIGMKSNGYLPEEYETDFVVAGPMSLVRYFTPKNPPSVRLTVLKLQPGSELDTKELAAFDGTLDTSLRRAATRSVFGSDAFREFPLAKFNRAVAAAGLNFSSVLKKGWQQTDLKAHVDAVMLPTLTINEQPILELSLIDSKGAVLAAAKEKLENVTDDVSVERAVESLATKIMRAFPFEGAVLSKDGDTVTINIGHGSGRAIRVGDTMDIYGNQSDAKGRNQTHTKIASMRVKAVMDQTSHCTVTSLEARATIGRGDLAILRARTTPTADLVASQIRVTTKLASEKIQALAQANVYLDDAWIGATDETGRVVIPAEWSKGSAVLNVMKHGYRPFRAEIALNKPKRIDVPLRAENATLRIESQPPGATVKVEGKVLGKTPLMGSLGVPSGFVKLELTGVAGYKDFSTVLELDEGILDLTGANGFTLEQDYIGPARALLAADKAAEALASLKGIPTSHSDYLLGKHISGEIYLTKLSEPAKAAEAFGEVTQNPSVKQFNDKRFIGSHVNEAISLFLTGEKLLNQQPEVARAHFQKAIEVFDAVVPQLRFVPQAEYAQAVHNVDYYRALSHHRIWTSSKDTVALNQAFRAWRDYVNGSAKTVPLDARSKAFAENAQIYLKQTQASLTMASGAANQ